MLPSMFNFVLNIEFGQWWVILMLPPVLAMDELGTVNGKKK